MNFQCHQSWNKMQDMEGGKFCNSCSKIVVDFTKMTHDEITHYFLQKKGEKVCGHISKKQLDRIEIVIPEKIFFTKLSFWKKQLIIILLFFGQTLYGIDVQTDSSNVIKKHAYTRNSVVTYKNSKKKNQKIKQRQFNRISTEQFTFIVTDVNGNMSLEPVSIYAPLETGYCKPYVDPDYHVFKDLRLRTLPIDKKNFRKKRKSKKNLINLYDKETKPENHKLEEKSEAVFFPIDAILPEKISLRKG